MSCEFRLRVVYGCVYIYTTCTNALHAPVKHGDFYGRRVCAELRGNQPQHDAFHCLKLEEFYFAPYVLYIYYICSSFYYIPRYGLMCVCV